MFNHLFKSEQALITEIHNEFDTAEDRLLTQAESLLTELNLTTESKMQSKAEKLKSLGFVNAEPVKWVKENSLVKNREDAELIKYYKQTYPFQKFLTEEELQRICKKYKLVYAPVSNYIKDVPEKNINEIQNTAKLLPSDIVKGGYKITSISFYNHHTKKYKDYVKEKAKLAIFDSGSVCEDDIRELAKDFNGDKGGSYYFNSATLEAANKNGLFIAAPKSHFNLEGLSKVNKFGFLNVTLLEVKDPIVFRYCRGGVQVISKWGIEGEDESLVNEKMN